MQRCGDQVEVFMDLDVSGGKRARRGYDAMLERIRAGGVDVVAAYDQSRAFRSIMLAAQFMELLEERAHKSIEVHFVHGSFDRSAEDAALAHREAARPYRDPATHPPAEAQRH